MRSELSFAAHQRRFKFVCLIVKAKNYCVHQHTHVYLKSQKLFMWKWKSLAHQTNVSPMKLRQSEAFTIASALSLMVFTCLVLRFSANFLSSYFCIPFGFDKVNKKSFNPFLSPKRKTKTQAAHIYEHTHIFKWHVCRSS